MNLVASSGEKKKKFEKPKTKTTSWKNQTGHIICDLCFLFLRFIQGNSADVRATANENVKSKE